MIEYNMCGYTYGCCLRSIHVVSQVHTMIIVPLALWSLAREAEERRSDKAFGWDDDVGFVHAVACGWVVCALCFVMGVLVAWI